MGLDYVRCPQFLYYMYGEVIELTSDPLLEDIVSLLNKRNTCLPNISYRWRQNLYNDIQNKPYYRKRKIKKGLRVSSVQLIFRFQGNQIVRSGRPILFEAYLQTNHDSRYAQSHVWEAHNLTDVDAMRGLLDKFRKAVTKKVGGNYVNIVKEASTELTHPVIRGTFSADLDGNRLDGETICRTDNKRWMPYGYDKPVRLDAGKLKNKKKWKKRFEGMSPATRAKLFALAR